MNGVVEITVKKKKHILRFGYHGCMELELRLSKNPDENSAKTVTDLVYSGLYGESMRSEMPKPAYIDVCDLVDNLSEQDDYSDQIQKVWDCYNESKWGKEFVAKLEALRLEELKKKELESGS